MEPTADPPGGTAAAADAGHRPADPAARGATTTTSPGHGTDEAGAPGNGGTASGAGAPGDADGGGGVAVADDDGGTTTAEAGAASGGRPAAGAAGEADAPGEATDDGDGGRDRRVTRLALALALLPLVVSAVALVLTVGGDYWPASDHALTEMHVRDVGRHEVLVGLYSRADWAHPGPMLFYLLAPFYWLTGGSSIGMNLGALAINGASIAGMALIARRRAGTPLMLCVLLVSTLMLRTLGAEFAHDPWNCFVTVLPFGLMVLLAWAMTCGETWALPVGAVVATYLAQTHVGFVLLAVPLLAWGAGWLLLDAWRGRNAGRSGAAPEPGVGSEPDGDREGEADGDATDGPAGRWREIRRVVLVTAGVLAVLWLPVMADVVLNAPSNMRKVVDWFGDAEEGTHTLAQGWRVITAQFGAVPEWLTVKKPFAWGAGESPYIFSSPAPLLLVAVLAACVVLWRRGGSDARRLVLTFALTMVLGVVAVARTVGPAFDYRLRWSWIPGTLGLALVGWAAWLLVADRWRRAAVPLTGVALAGLAAVTLVNGTTAATAGTPQGGDSDVLHAITPQVLDAIGEGDGQVVVSDVFANGAWYARGLVLQLERHGVDARVPDFLSVLFGENRVEDTTEEPRARLIVAMNDGIEALEGTPGLTRIASWTALTSEQKAELDALTAAAEADWRAGRLDDETFASVLGDIDDRVPREATASSVAVFLDERPATAG